MTKHTIKVTAKDIEDARKHPGGIAGALRCPVGLALQRKLKRKDIAVTAESIWLWNQPAKFYKRAEPKVSAFVKAYDGGAAVEPFSFQIEVPKLPREQRAEKPKVSARPKEAAKPTPSIEVDAEHQKDGA